MKELIFAKRVLNYLLGHPKRHEQDNFGEVTRCGTTMCIAGTAVSLDPDTEVFWDEDGMMETGVLVGGKLVDIDARAAELLGLDEGDASRLFYTIDNEDALDQLGDHIAAAEEASGDALFAAAARIDPGTLGFNARPRHDQ